ncbi:MAG: PHB depolymerase family esterase, partial [Parcubacteria group bacterium Gr01-1014_19]
VKNNSFAGSIETNENGEAEIKFDYHLGTGKPSVKVTVEDNTDRLISPTIIRFVQDDQGNYIGVKVKTSEIPSGKVAGLSTVHYWVVAKQDDYKTAPAISVPTAPADDNQQTTNDEQPVVTAEFPVIHINGNNPARIEAGSLYSDLGAYVTDDKNDNLGVRAEGAEIITSKPGVYYVVYSATDQEGHTSTARREVIVFDPYAEPVILPEGNSAIIEEDEISL